MKQRPRIYYTESQKALMWERWQKGESLQQIAQLFDRNHSSIERILAESGGIRPSPRRRSRLALTMAEREEISRAVVASLANMRQGARTDLQPSAELLEVSQPEAAPMLNVSELLVRDAIINRKKDMPANPALSWD